MANYLKTNKLSSTKKSYWLKSGMLTILERGSVFVFGFGGFYLLTRALSENDLGIWVIFYTLASFVEVGRGGLIQNALVKFLSNAENEEEYQKINTASIVSNGLVTICCLLVFIILAYPMGYYFYDAPELTIMLLIYCVTSISFIPFQQFNFIQMANLDFRGPFYSNFTKQGLFFLFILVSVYLEWDISLITLALAQVVTTLSGAMVSTFLARPYLRFSKKIDWDWVMELYRFGRFVFGTNISTMTYKSIDKLMLGSLLFPGASAIYEWAIKITNLVEVPTFSIASIVFPQSARRIKEEGVDGVRRLYEKSVGAILALILPFMIVVYFFAEFIILVLAGEEFRETIEILRLTIAYGLFIPFAVQFGTVVDSIGKPKINFYFTILGSALNILFNYIFISLYGIKGAAYGTLISYSIMFVIYQVVLYKLLGVKAYRAFPHIFTMYREGFQMARNYVRR